MKTVPLRTLKIILLVSSLVCLVLLLVSAFQENFMGAWRSHQSAYRKAAFALSKTDLERDAARKMRRGFKQVFLPVLNGVDRCPTCHAGIDDPRMSQEPQPLTAHPPGVFDRHPVDKFGCTVCHDGQGRAIEKNAAHGQVEHWPRPLLSGEKTHTSCSRCHHENDLFGAQQDLFAGGAPTKPLFEDELGATLGGPFEDRSKAIARGKKLVLESGCLGCHKYRGKGGNLGPDISFVGDKTVHDFDFRHIEGEHTIEQWLYEHFEHPARVSPGTLMPELGLSDEDARNLTLYMLSLHRKRMPAQYTPTPSDLGTEPAKGGEIYRAFCSGCHGKNGEGSTVREYGVVKAVDAPHELMVPSLNNPDTLAVASDNYLKALIHDGRPGTTMIAWGPGRDGNLHADDIAGVVGYIRSWEANPDSLAVSAAFGSAKAGSALFGRYCAPCHGERGEGGIGVSLNAPTFLAAASDEFLARTIIQGRPDTAMPGWKQFSPQHLSDLLAFIRALVPARSSPEGTLRLLQGHAAPGREVSARVGRILFNANCAVCHGEEGEGDLGPSLSSQEFLSIADDRYLSEIITRGRPGSGMPAWRHLENADTASVIKYLRTWQKTNSRTLPSTPIPGDWDAGKILFSGICASCHGASAEGASGPQLHNPVFLEATTDAMLREWIRYGRSGTPMRGFLKGGQGLVELSESQIDNIVAYVRSLERKPRVALRRTPDGRPTLGRLWYATACASCHGERGEGSSGPALANAGFLASASDGFLTATLALGRDGTEMRPLKKSAQSIVALSSDQINDVVSYLRSWETNPPIEGVAHRFVIPWDLERGERLYRSYCSGCHGRNGKGDIEPAGRLSAWAPELNNQGFLGAATDGFLQATIVRGRVGTAMRSFSRGGQGLADLTERDIDDLVAFIRRWSNQPGLPITIPAGIEPPGGATEGETAAITADETNHEGPDDKVARLRTEPLKGD